jgi:hypothetical protein
MSLPDPRSVTVDAAACVVDVDGQRRPFSIDLTTGAVTLGSGAGAVTIEPLTWREKLTLARFGRAEGRLLDSALIAHRLAGDDDRPVTGSAEDRALVALARWVNGFSPNGGAAPLDPLLLARIGAVARRAGELSSAELDRMPAVEVELLAEALPVVEARSETRAENDDGVTRIVIAPDPGSGEPTFDEDQAMAPDGTDTAVRSASASAPAPAPQFADLPYLGPAPLPAAAPPMGRPGIAGVGGAHGSGRADQGPRLGEDAPRASRSSAGGQGNAGRRQQWTDGGEPSPPDGSTSRPWSSSGATGPGRPDSPNPPDSPDWPNLLGTQDDPDARRVPMPVGRHDGSGNPHRTRSGPTRSPCRPPPLPSALRPLPPRPFGSCPLRPRPALESSRSTRCWTNSPNGWSRRSRTSAWGVRGERAHRDAGPGRRDPDGGPVPPPGDRR